jgi:ribonuclease HI
MPDPVQPTIRPATPADAALIAKLVHELAIYERAPEACHATEAKVLAALFGKRPAAEALIAEAPTSEGGGETCGMAIFFHNFSTWECVPGLYVEDIYVRPAWRRRGIGRALLARLAAIALERGCARMDLSVLDWNKPARDFYASIGFEGLTEWVPYRASGEALRELAEGAKAPAEEAMGRIGPRGQMGRISPIAEDEAAPATKRAAPARKAAAKKAAAKPAIPAEEAPAGIVVIHTDGGSQPNPGVGAWAAVLRSNDAVREVVGGALGTTNNRMELSAAIGALEALKRPSRVELHTDSAYVKNGITSWIKKWKRMGWRRGPQGSPVKNADLWMRLDELCQQHEVDWRWLKGHAGHVDNERCDVLCSKEIARLVAGSTAREREAALEAEQRRQEDEARGIRRGGDLFG